MSHELKQIDGWRIVGMLARGGNAEVYRVVSSLILETRGIVHRDLKPSNLCTRDGRRPVLIDFGFAKRRERELLDYVEELKTERFR